MTQWPPPDPLEWRNDRRLRFDIWRIFGGDVDRATVAIAAYERQQLEQQGDLPDGNVDPD